MKGNVKTPSYLKLVIKLILVILVLGFWYFVGSSLLAFVAEGNDFFHNKADIRRSCDYSFYDKEFGRLKEMFSIYSMEEPEFDIYREAVKGYEDYQTYRMYEKAAEKGVDGAERLAEEYRQKVLDNAKNCADPKNQKDLDSYVDNIS